MARGKAPARARVLRSDSEARRPFQSWPGAVARIDSKIPLRRSPCAGNARLSGAPALMKLRDERAFIDVVPGTALVVRVRAHAVVRRPVLRRGFSGIRLLPHHKRLPRGRNQFGSRVPGGATGGLLVRTLQGRGEDVELAPRSLVPSGSTHSGRCRLPPHLTALARGDITCPVPPFPYATEEITKGAIVELPDAVLPRFLNERELVVGQVPSVVRCALCHELVPLCSVKHSAERRLRDG